MQRMGEQSDQNIYIKGVTKLSVFCKHEFGKPTSFGFRNQNDKYAIQTLQKSCLKCGKRKLYEQKVLREYNPGYDPNNQE